MTDIQKRKLVVCSGTACVDPGGKKLEPVLKAVLKDRGIEDRVEVEEAVCYGACGHCPMIIVQPDDIFYAELTPANIERIVDEHIIGGKPIPELFAKTPVDTSDIRMLGSADFFGKQVRITLRNCGIIDPESFDDYLQMRGYEALAKVLETLTPDQVIEEIEKSGLRGRGGAGYPTGLKWRQATEFHAERRYVVCNADEGDPGAFMDRSAIEGDPFCLLEGMSIAGYAIGATQGYIYVRAEYPLAIKRLRYAIDEARKRGLLGKDIFGTGFNFDLDLRLGAGAFVCGEETALIASIEGRRGDAPAPPAISRREGPVGLPDAHQQRGDLGQRSRRHSQRGRLVREHGHREEQGDQGLRPRRQDQEHRPRRSADGHYPAGDHLRYRRRHPQRPQVQGRPDRRAIGRMHPRAVSSTPRSITNRSRGRAR